jgi:hypothetical protein
MSCRKLATALGMSKDLVDAVRPTIRFRKEGCRYHWEAIRDSSEWLHFPKKREKTVSKTESVGIKAQQKRRTAEES